MRVALHSPGTARLAMVTAIAAFALGSASAEARAVRAASSHFSFPPEYDRQAAMWLGWSEDASQHATQVQMIRALLPHVPVRLMVRSGKDRAEAVRMLSEAGIDGARVSFITHPLSTNWIRDSGPRFVSDGKSLEVADFAWNGYGYPAEIRAGLGTEVMGRGAIDNDIARQMKLPVVTTSIVSEGGALDVSHDVMLAYRQTAIERNPGVPFDRIEREYLRLYGKKKIVWMTRAPLSDRVFSGPKIANYFGWGANGHVDEFVRFVDDHTIAIAQLDPADAASNPLSEADNEILQENLAELRKATDAEGKPFRIIRFPVPGVQYYLRKGTIDAGDKKADAFDAWYRSLKIGDPINWVPAVSYLNFVISNGVVLAPAYWHEGIPQSEKAKDERARALLQQLFPGREVVQINPMAFNWSGGGMHCSTQQQPAVVAVAAKRR